LDYCSSRLQRTSGFTARDWNALIDQGSGPVVFDVTDDGQKLIYEPR
jgi:hypothetical protein